MSYQDPDKCPACGHTANFFPRMEVLASVDYEFEQAFDHPWRDTFGRLGNAQRLLCCPKCGTMHLELKPEADDD